MTDRLPFTKTLIGMAALGAAGGFLDAYSYTVRGGVLATAQTGNMVFLCVALANGNVLKALTYLIPIFSFSAGILIVRAARTKFINNKVRHWRSIVLACEILVLIAVAFTRENRIANALISFMCGAQLSGFKVANGNSVATTMCTGNLRSALDSLYDYIKTHDKRHAAALKAYSVIIFAFLLGAIIAALFAPSLKEMGVLIACIPLLFVAVFHFIID